MEIVVEILSGKIIGFSNDLKKTYLEYKVIVKDNITKTVWRTDVKGEGGTVIGLFSEQKPLVEIPVVK